MKTLYILLGKLMNPKVMLVATVLLQIVLDGPPGGM